MRKVNGDPSPIRKYALGTTGHDGVTAVVIKNVATRVVCANTLGVALGERGGADWRIQHTASAGLRLEEAGKAFHELVASYERFGELANVLAATPFTGRQMKATIDQVMPVPVDDADLEKLRGTAWAAFQGWSRPYRRAHRSGARGLYRASGSICRKTSRRVQELMKDLGESS